MQVKECIAGRPTITEINGVSVLTCDGRLKSRYSETERLQVLGATAEDLRATLDLFAPRRPYYAITRSGSEDPRDWATAKGRLRDGDVLRHLIGNLIPGQMPRWVAPKAWEATLWVGIDVDYRGDRDDYRDRCRKVSKALHVLGVPQKARLVSRTPSGGRHYRFFVTRAVRTDSIPQVLALVGLMHVSGQIEIFPNRDKGLRLPFGYIPGRRHNPDKWLAFIRCWQAGEFPKVCWLRCMRRAERYAQRQLEKMLISSPSQHQRQPSKPSSPATARGSHLRPLGIPKRKHQIHGAASGAVMTEQEKEYLVLLSTTSWTPRMAERLWALGIRLPGTRYAATTRMAWHLTHVKQLPVQAAGDQLCQWVYATGRTTSKDVQVELSNPAARRKVEKETRGLVQWCSEHRDSFRPGGIFSQQELDAIVKHVEGEDAAGYTGKDKAAFALNFLRFAKRNGTQTAEGWECQIAIRGIVRKWPGCSGMRYKGKMDWIVDSGLVKMTREKRQSNNVSGRPRTYLIQVPTKLATGAMLNLEQAQAYISGKLCYKRVPSNAIPSEMNPSDTYGRIIPSLPEKKTGGNLGAVAQAYSEPENTVCQAQRKFQNGNPLADSSKNQLLRQYHLSKRFGNNMTMDQIMLAAAYCQGLLAGSPSVLPSAQGPGQPYKGCLSKSDGIHKIDSLIDLRRLESTRLGIGINNASPRRGPVSNRTWSQGSLSSEHELCQGIGHHGKGDDSMKVIDSSLRSVGNRVAVDSS